MSASDVMGIVVTFFGMLAFIILLIAGFSDEIVKIIRELKRK